MAMKAQVIDLPAAPLLATSAEESLSDAEVTVCLLDGTEYRARLLSLSIAEQCVDLDFDGADAPVNHTLQEIRSIRFERPMPAAGGMYPVGSNGSRFDPELDFEVEFVDGTTSAGRTRSSLVDVSGLHFFESAEEGVVRRLFMPAPAVKHYRIGPRIGDAVAANKGVPREEIEALADDMETQRHTRLGDYLKRRTVLSPDHLREVLEKQALNARRKEPPGGFRIGELLVEEGLISSEDLDAVLKEQQADRKKKLGEVLIEHGVIEPDELRYTLADKLGIPAVSLDRFEIDHAALLKIPAALCRKYRIIPLFLYRGRLVIATADPGDVEASDVARFISGHHIESAIATPEDIDKAIERYYGSAEELTQSLDAAEEASGPEEALAEGEPDYERLSMEQPIVRLVNQLLMEGIRRRASDIHIRPRSERVQLLFRIDGALAEIKSFSKSLLPAIVARIKVIARMDVTEHRLPQDGRARMGERDNVVDLRISVIPTVSGESVVIRVLNTQEGLRDLAEVGLESDDTAALEDALARTAGMILVTGPTGSGKTTTLYACLQQLMQKNLQVVSVEEPVEYHIDGIEQIPVNRAVDYTFANALRHILRHDPDAIMIGEIRDLETARIAVETALTGHLVLSTLHANSAATAVTRFLDMGLEPYIVSTTLLLIIAQRLVRKNCPHCIAEEEVDARVRDSLGVGPDEVFYRGKGCEHCMGSGFFGRVVTYELIRITDELRAAILARESTMRLMEMAQEGGTVPLTRNALTLARERRTALSEVYRVRLD